MIKLLSKSMTVAPSSMGFFRIEQDNAWKASRTNQAKDMH
jgi:hypothetical protein